MIRRLSEDVRGCLRTGVALTSVAQCVEELVLNAVDAGATCVAVRLDLQAMTVTVVDSGQGIAKDQLPLVGERYSTSKCHTVDDLDDLRYFGYRGEALASLISASSFVEIVTRPQGDPATYSKCFHKGQPLSVTEPSRPRPGVGTTVTARNLFYNLPVRRKTLNEGLELERTRFRVAGLALMWPLISFSLRDEVSGNVVLQTRKCSGILGTFAALFGGARTKHMREVGGGSAAFAVSGYVSRENHSRKDLQFVFVNRRLVLKSKLHKLVNSVLSKSVLVRRRGANPGEKSRQEQESTGNASPTKLFERSAVFVINIQCSVNVYDITFDPAKTLVEFHDWTELTGLVEGMLMAFLREENLLPAEEGQEKDPGSLAAEASTSDTQISELAETDDPFDGNDEGVDEEFHEALQRSRLAQGISLHSTIHSLFSRTVRRPAAAREEEGGDGLSPSDPKKSRPNGSAEREDQHTPGLSPSDPKKSRPNGSAEREDQHTPGLSPSSPKKSRPNGSAEREDQHTPGLSPSSPKKSRPNGSAEREDQHTPSHQGHFKVDTSKSGASGRMTSEPKVHGASDNDDDDDVVDAEDVVTARQLDEAGSRQSSHGVLAVSDSTDSEVLEGKPRKIVLPKAFSPSKRGVPWSLHEKTVAEKPRDDTSLFEPRVKKICLPQELVQSLSLSRLRARVTLSNLPHPAAKPDTMSTQPTAALLHKFHRTAKQHMKKGRETEGELYRKGREATAALGEELPSAPTQIVLPSVCRPPLLRSRSLDARWRCSGAQDSSSRHRRCAPAAMTDVRRAQALDDSGVSYTSPRVAFYVRKCASGRPSDDWCHLPPEPGLCVLDPKVKKRISIPSRYQHSRISYQRLNDHREENDARDVHRAAHSNHTERTDYPRNIRFSWTDEPGNTEAAQVLSERKGGCSAVSRRAVTCTDPQSEAWASQVSRALESHQHTSGQSYMSGARPEKSWSDTSMRGPSGPLESHRQTSGQSSCMSGTRPEKSETSMRGPSRPLESHRQTSGQSSCTSGTRPAQQGAVHSATKPSSAAHSSTRSDLSSASSKPVGRVSQASKLARLMRTEQTAEGEGGGGTARLAWTDRGTALHKADCSHCEEGGRVDRGSDASSFSARRSSILKSQRGRYQATYTHTEKPYHKLTALEMLSGCQPSQNVSQPRAIHTEEEEKQLWPSAARSRFPELRLFEPHSVGGDTSDLAAHNSSERRQQQLETAATLSLFQTPQSVLCARDTHDGHEEDMARYRSDRHSRDITTHRSDRHTGDVTHRSGGHTGDTTTYRSDRHTGDITTHRSDRHSGDVTHRSGGHTGDTTTYRSDRHTGDATTYRSDTHTGDITHRSDRHTGDVTHRSGRHTGDTTTYRSDRHTGDTTTHRSDRHTGDTTTYRSDRHTGDIAMQWSTRPQSNERRTHTGDGVQRQAGHCASLGGAMTPPCHTVSSHAGQGVEGCGGSGERQDRCQQQTQGFSALSSQGFNPRLTEEGTLPFDLNPTKASSAQTDSPMSTHSAGFSPTAADPLMANPNTLTCSALPEITESPSLGANSMSCVSGNRTSQTQAPAETDSEVHAQNTGTGCSIPEMREPPAPGVSPVLGASGSRVQTQTLAETVTDLESRLSHRGQGHRGDSTAQPWQREIQAADSGQGNVDPEGCGHRDTDGLAEGSVHQRTLRQVDGESQATACGHRPEAPCCAGESSPSSPACQPSPSVLVPGSDSHSASLTAREASCTDCECCVPETDVTESSHSPTSVPGVVSPPHTALSVCESPAPTTSTGNGRQEGQAPSVCESPAPTTSTGNGRQESQAPSVCESPAPTTSTGNGRQEGQAPSVCESPAPTTSTGNGRQESQAPSVCESPAPTTSTGNGRQEGQGQKPDGEAEHRHHGEANILWLEQGTTVHKHPVNTGRDVGRHRRQAGGCSSEKQRVTASVSPRGGFPSNSRGDTDGKANGDGVLGFPCSHEKRRRVNQVECTPPSAGACAVGVPSVRERGVCGGKSVSTASDTSHTASDTSHTASDTSHTASDTSHTASDTSHTASDTSHTASDTSHTASDTSHTASDTSHTASDTSHTASDTSHTASDTSHTASDTSHTASDTSHTASDTSHTASDTSHTASDTSHTASDTSHTAARAACSSQQTDDFSASVPDSALVGLAMPGSLSPLVGLALPGSLSPLVATSVTEVSSADSLPDSLLAGISLPALTDPSQPPAPEACDARGQQASAHSGGEACTSPCSTDSVTDSALANVRTQDTQSQPGKHSGSFVSQANPEVSFLSRTSACFTQNAYNLGSPSSPTHTADQSREDLADPVSSPSYLNPSSADGVAEHSKHTSRQRAASEGSCPATVFTESQAVTSSSDWSNAASNNAAAVNRERGEEGEEEGKGGDGGHGLREAAWVPVTDPSTGVTVYMNSSSGHTLTLTQWTDRDMDPALTHRSTQEQRQGHHSPLARTKGMEELSPLSHGSLEALVSRHLETEETEETDSKWRGGREGATGENTVTNILNSWENPVFKKPEQVLRMATRSQAGKVAHCFFPPTSFTKAMLSGAKVVGQVDNKFVACVIQENKGLLPSTAGDMQDGHGAGLVVLFDQHAAHERVRLEQLLADVYEKGEGCGEGEKRRITRCDIDPPRVVDLSEEDVRLMQAFREEFDRIGLRFHVDEDRRDRVHAHTLPAIMGQREANDRKRGKDPLSYDYLKIMIKEHNQLLLSTAGARQQLPQQVHRLMATHACKGAVKFGDHLSMTTCGQLLSSLSSCDLPFQCAHGRPSIAPLVSLSQLSMAAPHTKRPPRLWRLRQKSATEDQQTQD